MTPALLPSMFKSSVEMVGRADDNVMAAGEAGGNSDGSNVIVSPEPAF
jgi:hypothetical protein